MYIGMYVVMCHKNIAKLQNDAPNFQLRPKSGLNQSNPHY